MNAKHFDAWTRRKFGLAAGSILAALLALSHTDGAGARRRCLRKGRVCSNTNKRCCGKLSCDSTFANGEFGEFCCKLDDASCKPGASEPGCCSTYCDAETETCRTCQGRPCDANRPCCPQWNCENDFCGGCAIEGAGCHDHRPCCPGIENCTNGYCGGCIRSLEPEGVTQCFSGGVPCCDTECTIYSSSGESGFCVSEQGGPCARDVDCRTCFDNFPTNQCDGACDNGECTV
jgi:hypothetical protein